MRDFNSLGIPVERLEACARRELGAGGRLVEVKPTALMGGYVSAAVYRVGLVFEDQCCMKPIDLVFKLTQAAEVRVMRALTQVPGASAFPNLLDSEENAQDPHMGWYLTPYYPGLPLTWEDEVPDSVVRSLARLHAHFLGQGERFPDLHRVDAAFFQRTLDLALQALQTAQLEHPDPRLAEAYRQVELARENVRMYQALAALPITVTHGDVHPGNILRSLDGQAVLIDWGTARAAPAMLDLANMVKLDSPQWRLYLAEFSAAAGRPVDLRLAHLGYHWATVQVNMQYLPFAVTYLSSEQVLAMVRKAVAAQGQIMV